MKVFGTVFRAAVKSGEELAVKAALQIVRVCAQEQKVADYEIVLNELGQWIEAFPDLAGLFLQVLSVLSRDADYARKMKGDGMRQIVQRKFGSHPRYDDYAEEFLENVH
jgi:hypothetical protein